MSIKKKVKKTKTPEFKKINYKKFIEENFLILDSKTHQPVPFKFNVVQDKYYRMLKDGYAGKLDGVRDIVLKARQEGISSFVLALFAVDFLMRPYSTSLCISHRQESTTFLFKKVKFYLDCYITKLAKETDRDVDKLKKEFFKSNNRSLLENKLNGASFYILTAGAKVGARGNSARNVLFCVGENTRIITPSGKTTSMKNIKVGDKVISQYGENTTVTKKWDTGIKKIKRIKLWLSNEHIDVTPDHKILTLKGWKKAKELTTDDWVEWSHRKTIETVKSVNVQRQKYATPMVKTSYGLKLSTNYDLGYFFGYYLAEGHVSKNMTKLSFACHKDETFYKKFLYLFPKKPVVGIRSNHTGTRKLVTYYSKELACFVNRFVGRVADKHIPFEFIRFFPRVFLKGLYKGWIDGDGSKTQIAHITSTTIHENIARQMRQIAMMVKQKALAVDYYPDRFRYGRRTKPVYLVREHGFGHKSGRRGLKYMRRNNRYFIKVHKIVDVEPQQTYEIEVANQSHAYLTVCGLISNSESAFFPNTELVTAEEMIVGTMQMIPQDKGMVFLESTGNQENGYFYELWKKAEQKEVTFKPIFFGWEEFYTPEWIEKKRKEFANEKKFLREYPRTPEDAFLASGTPFFDVFALREMEEKYKRKPMDMGRFSTGGYLEKCDHEKDAMVKIYREIDEDEQLVVFADPADSQDFCAAVACSKRHYDFPIVFNAKMESSQFGYELYYFCNWIQNRTGIWPKLAVERNTGQATIYVLKQLNYPDLFRMVDFTAKESGIYEKGAIGWTTTGYVSGGELKGTRRKMLDDFALALRQRMVRFYDKEIYKQMKAFKIIKGRAQAASNVHDDLTIACYSDDTEALTASGWKKIVDIKSGEKIPSLNLKTNVVEEAINLKTINEPFSGEMVHFKNRSIDFLVTSNHQMVYHRSKGANQYEDLQFVQADSLLGKHFRLHKNAEWSGIKQKDWIIEPNSEFVRGVNERRSLVKEMRSKGFSVVDIEKQTGIHWRLIYKHLERDLMEESNLIFDTDDFLSLLGFYIAEGSGRVSQKDGSFISLAQREYSKGYKPMKHLLTKMKIKHSYNGTQFGIHQTQLAKYIKRLIPGLCYEKRIPRKILNLHPKHLRHLYHFMMLGDGCFSKTPQYTTTSKGLADDFVELVNKLGWSGTIHVVDHIGDTVAINSKYKVKRLAYVITIIKNHLRPRLNHHKKNAVNLVDYKGNQVCLTLDKNHIFLVRRNGATMWCGNCCGAFQIQQLTPDFNFGWSEDKKTQDERRAKWRFK